MKASDLFIKALENEGVEYIFGIPGEENLDFLDSLKDSHIKLILTRHEQGAGFMAATYGRLTGKPGVCLATLGPGATNFVTPSCYSQLGAMPMLMITGQKPIKKSKQGQFQIVDIVKMMHPITKYTKQIVNANNITTVTREAFRIAIEERPGAVHIELPEDIAAEELSDYHIVPVADVRRPIANTTALDQVVQRILDAKSPLLLIGAGANRKRTAKALLNFVEKTQIPFFNTQMGKGVIDERHSLFLGTAALSSNDYLHCAIDRADLIINIGHDVIEKPPFIMNKGGAEVVHINFNAPQIDEVYFPQYSVIGDIASSIESLSEVLIPSPKWDFSFYHRIKQYIDEHIQEGSDNNSFPIKPQRLVADIRKALPENGIVTLDNGVYKIWFARNYTAYQPNTLLLDNALATMGAGLPSAMAAKMVRPDSIVISVCGDGGFMMNSQEIETAVRLNLHIIVIILKDNAYGMIKWKQSGMNMPNFGLDYGNPDFVKYAESYGAKGHALKSTEGFIPLLQSCQKDKSVHIIEVPVDYSENQKVLIDELQKAVCLI